MCPGLCIRFVIPLLVLSFLLLPLNSQAVIPSMKEQSQSPNTFTIDAPYLHLCHILPRIHPLDVAAPPLPLLLLLWPISSSFCPGSSPREDECVVLFSCLKQHFLRPKCPSSVTLYPASNSPLVSPHSISLIAPPPA